LLIDAMKALVGHPVHLDVVGVLKGPTDLIQNLPDNVTLHGAVAGSEVDRYYQNADIFMFPTLSDGFGLTQLEAQSLGLPIIASNSCAAGVAHGVNGIIRDRIDGPTSRYGVLHIRGGPALTEKSPPHAISMEAYSREKLSQRLRALEQ